MQLQISLLNHLDTRHGSSTVLHPTPTSAPLLTLRNQGDDHSENHESYVSLRFHPHIRLDVPVKIVEKGQQIETELDETLLLVPRQRPKNFRRIVHVVFIPDSVGMKRSRGG